MKIEERIEKYLKGVIENKSKIISNFRENIQEGSIDYQTKWNMLSVIKAEYILKRFNPLYVLWTEKSIDLDGLSSYINREKNNNIEAILSGGFIQTSSSAQTNLNNMFKQEGASELVEKIDELNYIIENYGSTNKQ